MREMVARIHAVLRRAGMEPQTPEKLSVGDITLDRTTHEVTVGERQVDLTPSEFDMLALFMESPGRVYSRMDLLEKLQGSAFEGAERTIDVHVRNLRAKVEPDPAQPEYIETVFGVGYRMRPGL